MHSLPAPHPARACGAPPPPHPGRGPCPGVYQVSSRIRGVAGGPPCPALLQDLPMCWTVGISPLGEGPTGRGNSFPLPCLPRSSHLTSPASPSPVFHTPTILLLAGPPTPPAPSALLPRPLPGAGSVRGDTWWAAVSGSSPGSPHAVDRGDIATGGGADGEGERVPPPLSPSLPELRISHRPCPGSL